MSTSARGILLAALVVFGLYGCGRKPKRFEVTHVSLGQGYACFTQRGGEVRCTGPAAADLGAPLVQPGEQPARVPALEGAERVILARGAGAGQVACRVDAGAAGKRALACWGRGGSPEVVSADVTSLAWTSDAVCFVDAARTPSEVRCVKGLPAAPRLEVAAPSGAPAGARSVCVGPAFGCAVTADGKIACWGATSELVGGEAASRGVTVAGVADAVSIACGPRHACAVLASGHVACFGSNESGQLGRPPEKGSLPAAPVVGVDSVASICAGHDYTCSHLRNGLVACWGDWGGGPSEKIALHRVFSATEVACGPAVAVAPTKDHSIYAWGADRDHLLPGSRERMSVPSPLFLRK